MEFNQKHSEALILCWRYNEAPIKHQPAGRVNAEANSYVSTWESRDPAGITGTEERGEELTADGKEDPDGEKLGGKDGRSTMYRS